VEISNLALVIIWTIFTVVAFAGIISLQINSLKPESGEKRIEEFSDCERKGRSIENFSDREIMIEHYKRLHRQRREYYTEQNRKDKEGFL